MCFYELWTIGSNFCGCREGGNVGCGGVGGVEKDVIL